MAHLVGSSKQLLKGLSLLALSGSAPLLTRATPASLVEAVTAEVGALIGTASEEQHGENNDIYIVVLFLCIPLVFNVTVSGSSILYPSFFLPELLPIQIIISLES